MGMVKARGQATAAQNQSSILPEPQTCRDCGRPLPGSKPITLCGRTFQFGPTICVGCADACQKPAEPSQWEQICPLEYQRTDVARLEIDLQRRGYDTTWMEPALAWQYGPHGLLVAGSTGVGKSRIMWILLRRLLDSEHRNVVWLNAVRFRSGLQTAARDGATEYFVRRLVRTDVLYWDDLGQTHLTGAASEMLLHVIEQRTASGAPILATTQYSAESMEFQLERPEMGQAIRRRLNEFCRVVVVRGSEAK
jgi:IstB-like ATP binding protein